MSERDDDVTIHHAMWGTAVPMSAAVRDMLRKDAVPVPVLAPAPTLKELALESESSVKKQKKPLPRAISALMWMSINDACAYLHAQCLAHHRRPDRPAERTIVLFDADYIPDAPLITYMAQVVARMYRAGVDVCVETLVLSVRLLVKMCEFDSSVRVHVRNAHSLWIVALIVALKMDNDAQLTNSGYAELGGLAAEALNALEIELLFRCRFETFATLEELASTTVLMRSFGAAAAEAAEVAESAETTTTTTAVGEREREVGGCLGLGRVADSSDEGGVAEMGVTTMMNVEMAVVVVGAC
jgi:hypothetical protein